jgi:hypothetical protein
MKRIDHHTATSIKDCFPKAYFGNPHQYGELMGYHVGDASMIYICIPNSAVLDWKDKSHYEIKTAANAAIEPLGLPVEFSALDFFGDHYQLYFSISS